MPFTLRLQQRFPVHCAVTLPNEQRIEILDTVVRSSRGQEFAVESVSIEPHTHARLQHYVKRLVQEQTTIFL